MAKALGFNPTPFEMLAGFFPVKRRNSLLAVEARFFEEKERERLKAALPLLRLAARIGEDSQISVTEALQKIQEIGKTKSEDLGVLAQYTDELEAIFIQNFSELDYRISLAVLVLNCRVPKLWLNENQEAIEEEFDLSLGVNPENGELIWEAQSVQRLSMALLEACAQFLLDEQSGGISPKVLESSTEPEAVIVKKPLQASKKASKVS